MTSLETVQMLQQDTRRGRRILGCAGGGVSPVIVPGAVNMGKYAAYARYVEASKREAKTLHTMQSFLNHYEMRSTGVLQTQLTDDLHSRQRVLFIVLYNVLARQRMTT